MVALRPDHDLTEDDAITHFSVYYSKARRCGQCVVPKVLQKQIFEKWDGSAKADIPYTVAEAKADISVRCGDCALKGWPKVSLVDGILWLHVASGDRRKIKSG